MSITAAVLRTDSTQAQIIIDGVLTFAGSYVVGGVAVNLAFDQAKTLAKNPIKVEIYENPATGVAATGHSFIYEDGADLTSGQVQIFGGLTEVTAVTFASLNLPTVNFRAWYPSFAA